MGRCIRAFLLDLQLVWAPHTTTGGDLSRKIRGRVRSSHASEELFRDILSSARYVREGVTCCSNYHCYLRLNEVGVALQLQRQYMSNLVVLTTRCGTAQLLIRDA